MKEKQMKKYIFTFSIAALSLGFGLDPAHAFRAFEKAEISAPLAVQVSAAGAEDFISGMAQEAIDFLGDQSMSQDQRRVSFRNLLQNNFDMYTIGRFALGRYWQESTEAQRQEYQKLFKQMVVDVYSNRFKEYSGQNLEVRGSNDEGKDVIVNSAIVSPGNPPVKIDWRVRNKGGGYKVVDVIVEGVSMTFTQRSDFASVIQRGGGDIEVLLDHLRNK